MAKQAIPPIEKGRIRLRLLDRSDLPTTLRWRNQDHIRKWFIHPEVISPEQHQEWFEKYARLDNDYVFVVEEIQTLRKPVGQISLYNIAWSEKRAELGRVMIGDPQANGQGLAKQATQIILELAFRQFRLEEVYLEVFRDNMAAIAIYQQCGFQPSRERDHLLVMNLFNPNLPRIA